MYFDNNQDLNHYALIICSFKYYFNSKKTLLINNIKEKYYCSDAFKFETDGIRLSAVA